MLKHCQATAVSEQNRRSRRNLSGNPSLLDNTSLNSSGSASFNSSFGSCDTSHNDHLFNDSRRSSFSSPDALSFHSRASSFASLSLDPGGPRTPIKIFAKCLRSDIEYKTLSVGHQTTSKEVIWMLLSKFRMRHRDPNLFFLTMDITIKRTGVPLKRTLVLEDDSRPAELKSCHPWGECRFNLQMRKGGLVRVHDSVLMEESKYKCLLIAEHTTVEEVIKILFHCYGLERLERVERFCIFEQCQSQCYERRLHPTDRPAQVQSLWPNPSQFMFVLKRDNQLIPSSTSVSPNLSDVESMDVSETISLHTVTSKDSPTPTSENLLPKLYNRYYPPKTNFMLNGAVTPKNNVVIGSTSGHVSIHESGLPPPPALLPKPAPKSLLMNV